MADSTVTYRVVLAENAAPGLRDTAAAAQQAAAAEKALAAASAQANRAARASASGIGAASAQAQNLRFQLFDIGQQLSAGVNPLVILSQQGPQVAQALTGGASAAAAFKGALGPVLPVMAALAPIMAAVAPTAIAAGAAYLYFANELENAEEKAAKMSATATKMQVAHLANEDAVTAITRAYRVASGQIDAETASTEAAVAALEGRRAAERAVMVEIGSSAAALAAYDAKTADLADTIERTSLLTWGKAEADRAAAEAARTAAAAAKAAAAAEKERARALEQQAVAAARAKVALAALAAAGDPVEAENFRFTQQVEEINRLAEEAGSMWGGEAEAQRIAAVNAELEKHVALLTDIQHVLVGMEDVDLSVTATPTAAGTAGTVAAAIASPLDAAAGAHPIAAAVVAGIRAASTGGSALTDAADLVLSAVQNLGNVVESAFDAAITLVTKVPAALVESLPDIVRKLAAGVGEMAGAVAEGASEIVVALAEAIPEMIPDLVLALAEVFVLAVPMIVVALVDAFTDPATYEAIGEAFVNGIERMFERIGDIFDIDGGQVGQTSGGVGDWLLQAGRDIGRTFDDATASKSTASSTTVLRLDGRDFLSDFVRSLDLENGPTGRVF